MTLEITLKTCSTCGTESEKTIKGLCVSHYMAAYREKAAQSECSVENCSGPVHARKRCGSHYRKLLVYGKAKHKLLLKKQDQAQNIEAIRTKLLSASLAHELSGSQHKKPCITCYNINLMKEVDLA